VVRHSSHPLSTILNDFLKDEDYVAPSGYDEVPGQGITALVNDQRINVGSRVFCDEGSRKMIPLPKAGFM